GLAMLASTSMHLHELIKQIEALKAHTGAQRVAEFLLSLTNLEDGACTLMLPYDKALIAGRLGIKPESLSRAFQKLRSYGVMVKQNTAQIENLAVLQDLVDQERAVVMQQKR
ncbi:MAG TPA: cyclic nucleotide-binding protein, partial [Rhizobiales bacterium]|nr:cyclic nucleotide-binding protein [Hyphomicrobiales bacterium]